MTKYNCVGILTKDLCPRLPDMDSSGTVNVASVPQISPFRYPGGKTWLIPWIRLWLKSQPVRPKTIVEAFAGGASVSLTAVFENLVDQAILIEKDKDVSAVWQVILRDGAQGLAKRIAEFDCTGPSVARALSGVPRDLQDQAFRTIVMNRTRYGGIIAAGAAPLRNGENGHGIGSRWYGETLKKRIEAIAGKRDRLVPIPGEDGLVFLELAERYRDVVFFVDPPYTVAGKRLYTHTFKDVDHERLFRLCCRLKGDFLITYDDAPQIRDLALSHGLEFRLVPMRSTKHELKKELLIGRKLGWVGQQLGTDSALKGALAHGTPGS
jgi:DNA adenine methylase